MNDLLTQSFAKARNYVDLKKETFRGGDLEAGEGMEMASMGGGEPQQDMTRFFEEVGVIKGEMERVKQSLAKIQAANEETKTVHRAQAMKALRERMDEDIRQVTKIAKSIKVKLEDLDRANIANRSKKGCEEGTSTDRTRTSITGSLRKKLKDLMGEFQSLRQRMMGDYRETVERRYYTVTGQQPDEETIENIIETGKSESFLQQAIQEQGRGQIIETIREIQERHDAVKDIEKNLLELHQIFMDMAVLVEAQGEQLNDIEQQVNKASSYIQRGTTQLVVAKQHQRNTRKCVFIAILLLVIIFLIILLSVLKSTNVIK